MMFIWGAGGLVMMLMMLVFWGLVIAGLVLGVAIPLLRGYLEQLPRVVFQATVIAVLAGCVLAATLRPGGSLRG